MPEEPLTYRDAGVDIERAERSLGGVFESIRETYTEHVVQGVGGFGGVFRAEFPDCEHPMLVCSIDGVGTKTKVAAMAGRYDWLGQDIVNHCINDILCQGARPLFFVDYFGCSRLPEAAFSAVVRGAAQACKDAGCALIGGETAEMPGVYVEDEVDVVGTIVGVVDQDRRQPRGKMQSGDALIGIASSGLHTNGYSLARRALFDVAGYSVRDPMPSSDVSIGDALLIPHRSYLRSVFPLLQEDACVLAVAHITGGGIYGNLIRVLAVDVQAIIDRRSWVPLPIFRLIQDAGGISDQEMFGAFNMGIGMIVVCRGDRAPEMLQRLLESGESATIIGHIQSGARDVQIV